MSHPSWLVIPKKLLSTSRSSLRQFQGPGVPVSRAALRLALDLIPERKPQSTYRRSAAVLVHLPLRVLCCRGEGRLRPAEPLSTFHQHPWEGAGPCSPWQGRELGSHQECYTIRTLTPIPEHVHRWRKLWSFSYYVPVSLALISP